MKQTYNIFLKKLLLYTLFIGLTGVVFAYVMPARYLTPHWPYLIVFFFSVTLLVHYILLKATLKKTGAFINLFMLLTFGKLIFFLTIMLIYAFTNRDDAPRFIITFFILYLLFTIFEVYQSLGHSKMLNEKNKQT
jgi:hypothetical protein